MSFRIQSSETEYYLVSNGEDSDGSFVATLPKNEDDPSITVRILVHVLNPFKLTMVVWQTVTLSVKITLD